MLDKTLGYILCCQSPALFLAALALLVAYLAGRKHKVRAFFRLLLCILCAAGGVALYATTPPVPAQASPVLPIRPWTSACPLVP